MSLAAHESYSHSGWDPHFSHEYSNIVSRAAESLTGAHEAIKSQVFQQAEMLCAMLALAAKNPICLDNGAIRLVQSILEGMEKHLDGETRPFELDGQERERLEKVYLNLSQQMCVILIQRACMEKDAANAG